ncbi:MAG: TauD/TfdA dioxygenase family protein [Gammaproteobacteria bacterium]
MSAEPAIASPGLSSPASPYRRLRVSRYMPHFGAWIEGVDLAAPFDAETGAELRRAMLEHGVVFLRNQGRLTAQRHAELSHVIGNGPSAGNAYVAKHSEHPGVELLVAEPDRRTGADRWHSDITWRATPPLATLIQLQELPPVGGDTIWASATMAWDWMSDALKRCIDGLTAVHALQLPYITPAQHADTEYLEAYLQRMRTTPPVEHPVVMRHPITGRKSLFVNETFTRAILGLNPIESDGLLRLLFNWLKRPEFLLRHKWEPDGIALWDNYAVQHYAVDDYGAARRVNQRVTINL